VTNSPDFSAIIKSWINCTSLSAASGNGEIFIGKPVDLLKEIHQSPNLLLMLQKIQGEEYTAQHFIEDYLINGLTRVYSILYLMVFLVVLFSLLFGYYYLLNRKERRGKVAKCILSIGEKVGLDKFNKTLNLY